jgi:hypothetical protein
MRTIIEALRISRKRPGPRESPRGGNSAQNFAITIRYTDVVPDNGANPITWDLDNGGVLDFELKIGTANKVDYSRISVLGDGTGIAERPTQPGTAERFLDGEVIGGAGAFAAITSLYSETNPTTFAWTPPMRGYLGLRIQLNNNTHYGWADVTLNKTGADAYSNTLHAYAYNDAPNQPIVAGAIPEPTTAALLVAGAAGASALRRRRA